MFFSQSSSEESVDTFFRLIMMAQPARPLSVSKLLERINKYHCQMSNVCWPAMTIPASMACALLCAYWAGRLSVPGTPPVD